MPKSSCMWTLEREDAEGNGITLECNVEYEYASYIPMAPASFNDPGAPAEGGYVEGYTITSEDGTELQLTPTEDARLTEWIEQNDIPEDEVYDGYYDDNY